jgi:hypothetical protein
MVLVFKQNRNESFGLVSASVSIAGNTAATAAAAGIFSKSRLLIISKSVLVRV